MCIRDSLKGGLVGFFRFLLLGAGYAHNLRALAQAHEAHALRVSAALADVCLLYTSYPVSIYGFPHGFNGTDSFSQSRFSNGQYFYAVNNYYGMMCVHFVGSTTHGGTSPDSKHQAAINTAYDLSLIHI